MFLISVGSAPNVSELLDNYTHFFVAVVMEGLMPEPDIVSSTASASLDIIMTSSIIQITSTPPTSMESKTPPVTIIAIVAGVSAAVLIVLVVVIAIVIFIVCRLAWKRFYCHKSSLCLELYHSVVFMASIVTITPPHVTCNKVVTRL